MPYPYLIQPGDEVIINISDKDEFCDHTPCPDKTLAKVLEYCQTQIGRFHGYFLKPPGIYHRLDELLVCRENDGITYRESEYRLQMVDEGERLRRLSQFELTTGDERVGGPCESYVFHSDLPETPFWEGDVVTVKGRREKGEGEQVGPGEITWIQYLQRYDRYSLEPDGKIELPRYKVSMGQDDDYVRWATADELTLVERGPTWKLFHDEPIAFDDPFKEARFYKNIGDVERVQMDAPVHGDAWVWPKERLLPALEAGIIHAFGDDRDNLFGGINWCRFSAWRFHDPVIGSRIAKGVLSRYSEWLRKPFDYLDLSNLGT